MLKKQPISNQHIIDCLNTDYGINVATLIPLSLGADMNAFVYKVETKNQSSYFIKLKRGHHPNISTTITRLLHDAGIQQIILPIKTKGGQSTLCIDDFTLLVFPFIEGQDGFNRDLTDSQWVTLGKIMRQIHQIEVPPSIQSILRQEVYSSKWREIVRLLYSRIEPEPSNDEIASKLRTFIQGNIATIQQLVDRAEQLSQSIQKRLSKFVLCHSDIHGGNVLIDKNNTIYVVDWDDPIMAPRERDLMFIGGGVANVWNKPHEEKFFYKGYGQIKVNMEILAYYRFERIVEDIALLGQQLLLAKTGDQDRAQWYKHFIAQFEPRGVVEMAFKADKGLTF